MVAHWEFEEGSGTTAGDSAGGNDGTLVNGAAFLADTFDDSAFSMSFDGIDDHVVIANTPDLEITGTAITLAAWIRPQDAGDPGGGSRVISKRTDAGGSDVYAMYTYQNRLRFRLDGQDMISDHVFLPGKWLHVAMVYDGVDKRIYVNGALDGAAPQAKSDSIDASARAVHLGHREGESRYFDGEIDDVRIYDQALSAAEISDMARPGSNLVARWTFEEGSGTTAGDSAGVNDGTLVNGPTFVADTVDGSAFSMSFDGIDDRVVIANTPALEITGTEITLAAWIKPLDAGDPVVGSRVISKRTDAGGSDVYAMYTFQNRLRFRIDGQDMISNHAFVPGEWLHVAMVYDGEVKRIYIDGVMDEASPQNKSGQIDASARAVHLGHREGESHYFNGLIDDARIYKRALTGAEIANIAERPIADAGFSRTAALGETVVLDGGGSRSPGELELSYSWLLLSVPPSSATVLSDPAAVKPRLDIDLPGDYVAELTVSDGTRQSAPSSVTISTANSPPVANAGPDVSGADIVSAGLLQTLDGSKSWDPDGDPLSFQWRVVAEPVPGTSIVSDTSPRTYFEAANQGGSLISGRYLFELTVSDGVSSDTDTVALTANQNLPPRAEAGPHARGLFGADQILDLDGTTDHESDEVSRAWSLIASPSGSAAALSVPADGRPRLAADVPGDYVVQLSATDSAPSFPSTIDTLVISTQNTPPVASAGPTQTHLTGSVVQLDAGASTDVDEDGLTYRWALIFTPFGSGAALSDPEAVRPTFTADLDGVYVAQVTVHDGTEAGVPSTVFIAASDLVIDNPNELHHLHPVADAGPDQTVPVGQLAQLDGSGSFYPDNVWNSLEALAFEWSILSAPESSTAALSDPAAVDPTFVPDQPGLYVVQLAVQTVSPSVRVLDTVTISTANSRPVADAGADQPAAAAPVVQLDGNASADADGTALNYRWAVLFKPPGSMATLSNPGAAAPSLSVGTAGTYVVQLIVDDGALESRPDTVVIEVVNTQPVANAGPDQSVISGSLVQLDGSASSDADNDPLQFSWSLVSVPAGSTAALSDPNATNPTFTTDLEGTYVAELLVNDGLAGSAPDQVTVTATNAPPVLDPIGNQTVDLGSTLSLTLSGSDLNGDPLSFSATPLPLPTGTRLEAGSGLFSFTPLESQVGDVVLTFAVSDGQRSDSETVTITVVGPLPGGVTALAGRVLDANAAALGQSVPVEGATVSVVGSGVSGTTDANGDFSLSGLPGGEQVLLIDAQTAAPAPDGSAYASAEEDIELIAAVTNDPAVPFFLARIDQASAATYDPASPDPTTVTSTALGVDLEVAPGSASLDGAPFNGTLTLSELPPGQALGGLPALISPCQLMTLQPLGVAFSPPAQITLPNLDSLPAGTEVDLWSLDPATGRFQTVGTGQVSPGGADITTLTGGIPAAGPLFAVPRGPEVAFAQDENADNRRPSLLADGNLPSAITIPGVTSLGVTRDLTFVYNSTAADAQPIVAAEITFPSQAGLPPLLQGRLEVGGIETGTPVFMSTSTPADPGDPGLLPGETVRLGAAFDAAALPSGSHPTRYVATSDYGCSKVGTAGDGRVLVSNQSGSPFGSGWTIEGLHRLTEQSDGRILLETGDGAAQVFTPFGAVETAEDALELGAPPQTVVVNAFESDTNLFVFSERLSTAAPAGVQITAAVPKFHGQAADLVNGTLPAGVIVNSHFIHFDPLGADLEVEFSQGQVAFPTDIVGIMVRDANLNASDAAFGDPDTAYPDPNVITVPNQTSNLRGLEFGAPSDSFEILDDLRTLKFDFATNAAADQIRVLTAPKAEVLAVSDFRIDAEGWGTADNGASAVHDAAGGHPDGRLVVVDDMTGALAAFSAPQTFLDALPQAYAGRLSYDRQASSNVNQIVGARDVTLAGAGLTLTFAVSYQPVVAPAWQHVNVLLHEGAGWVKFGTSTPPTQAEFQAVLAAPTLLTIRGDFLQGVGDSGGLDNVVLHGQAIEGTIASPKADFSRLAANADGTFTRVLPDGRVYQFDTLGRVLSETDPNGNATRFEYDAEGRLTKRIDPSNTAPDPACGTPGVACMTYNAAGVLERIDTPDGRSSLHSYDPGGNLASVTNPDGSIRDFIYDSNDRLIAETSARGFTTTHGYGAAGRWTGAGLPDGASVSAEIARSLGLADLGLGLGTPANPLPFARPGQQVSRFTDGNGNVTSVKLNRFGSPTEITDALGRTTVLERDADDQVIRVTAPSDGELPGGATPGSVVTELDYDGRGNVTAQREAVGTALERQTLFEYEPVFNKVTRILEPGGFETLFEYDAAGNLTKVTDALGGTRVSTYDARGLKLTERDPNTNLTTFAYDIAGNLERITDALANVTAFTTDAAGRVTARTEGLGTPEARTTSFTYDAMNRVLSETDGAGGTTSFLYDAAGNVIEETDPTGIVTFRSYDERDRLIEEDDPLQGPVTRTYDKNGNLKTIANALGNTVTLEYDAANRATKTVDPLSQERLFTWDAQNNLKTLTDGNTNVSSFAYDLLGRQIRRANALSETWSQAFDSRDNLVQTVDAKGQVIDRVYDDLSRLTGITLIESDGTTVEDTIAFTYDANSNRLSATDGDSNLAFTYDALNRLETAETLATAGTVQPAVVLTSLYDALGLRKELRHGPDAITVDGTWSYTHDGAGRLTGVVNPANDNVTLDYDLSGRLTQVAYPNQTAMDVAYGPGARVDSVTHSLNATPFSSFAYGYQADGLITSTQEAAGTRNFTYDDTQQLLTAGFAATPESYAYDAEGNRTASHLSAAHVHDAANRLIEDDGFCYGYDANGNLTGKTAKVAGACTGDLTVYSWDVQNRLVRIDVPGGGFAAYRYDADGRRIEKDVDGAITRYVYDDDDIVLEFDGANALVARFSHGEEVDQPLVMERVGQSHFYHVDFLGSVRRLTNAAGTVVNSYDYDAYGNFETRSEAVANPYTYTAREFDPESGLHFYRARYYDPVAGRFLSEDPIGLESGDANAYRYVFNSPIMLVDPAGLGPLTKIGALVRSAIKKVTAVATLTVAVGKTAVTKAKQAVDKVNMKTITLQDQFAKGLREGLSGTFEGATPNATKSEIIVRELGFALGSFFKSLGGG